MSGFGFEPVRWATVALAVLAAVIGVNDQFGVLPDVVTPYLNYAAAVLALLLGAAARERTTALAAPRDAAGERLVPASVARGR
jgi:hypothetical protein